RATSLPSAATSSTPVLAWASGSPATSDRERYNSFQNSPRHVIPSPAILKAVEALIRAGRGISPTRSAASRVARHSPPSLLYIHRGPLIFACASSAADPPSARRGCRPQSNAPP